MAGFFDAEGCVSCHFAKRPDGHLRHQLRVTVACTDARPLGMFSGSFGGKINCSEPRSDRHRVCWRWSKALGRNDAITTLLPFLVTKASVMGIAADFLSGLKLPGGRNVLCPTGEHRRLRLLSPEDTRRRDELFAAIRGHNASSHAQAPAVAERPLEYFAGLFDGDGYVGLRPNSTASRSRSGTRCLVVAVYSASGAVLELLQRTFGGSTHPGYGGRKAGQWTCTCSRAESFLAALLPFLLVRRDVAMIAVEARRAWLDAPRSVLVRFARSAVYSKPQVALDRHRELCLTFARMNRLGPR